MTNSRVSSGVTNLTLIQKAKGDYFNWLCEKVCINREEDSYYILAKTLHEKEFYGFVPNDENRASDGQELRKEYAREETDTSLAERAVLDILSGPCTVFEMLIALAERINFILSSEKDSDNTAEYFWEMIRNLKLDELSDGLYFENGGTSRCHRVLNTLLMRTYTRKGVGGLFPLKKCKDDQRNVEIWYQMCAYLEENHRIPD